MLTKNIWNKKIRLSQGKVVDQRYPNMKRNLEKKMLKKMISKCLKKTSQEILYKKWNKAN